MKYFNRQYLFYKILLISLLVCSSTSLLAQHNPTEQQLLQHHLVQHELAQYQSAQHNLAQDNLTQYHLLQHNLTQDNLTQYHLLQHNLARHHLALHSLAQHNSIQNETIRSEYSHITASFSFPLGNSQLDRAENSGDNKKWECNFDQAKDYPEQWQGNLDHFCIKQGRLLHKGLEINGSRLSYLNSSTPIDKYMSWEGNLEMRQKASARHHVYFLLYPYHEMEDTEEKFVALSFGRTERMIRLVTVSLEDMGDKKYKLREEGTLISDSRHIVEAGEQFWFKVYYSANQGWKLWIKTESEPVGGIAVGQSLYLPPVPSIQGQLGIAVSYTNRSRESVWIDGLKVSASSSPMDIPGVDPSKEDEQEPTDPGNTTDMELIRINEIMANPLKGSAEYIELYNGSEKAIKGDRLAIGIVRNREVKTLYPLPKGVLLPPQDYIVLSEDADLVAASYPFAIRNRIHTLPYWPRLSNKGCSIALILMGEEYLGIDQAEYSTAYFEKELKSKAGVAAEKVSPLLDGETSSTWRSALPPHYASPGVPNTRAEKGPNTPLPDIGEKEGEKERAEGSVSLQTLMKRFVQMLKDDKSLTAEIRVYTLDGRSIRRFGHEQCMRLTTLLEHPLFNPGKAMRLQPGNYLLVLDVKDGKETKQLGYSHFLIQD
ncbi:hypothetical protein SAMN02745203_01502 [Porphyromonas crevioricanis]|nr:hypothetical protein SAMN02745203_01502 [Porphyromonas crevioricanis]